MAAGSLESAPKQKDMEYRTVRHQQNRLWQEVFELNYHKALDHRGVIEAVNRDSSCEINGGIGTL